MDAETEAARLRNVLRAILDNARLTPRGWPGDVYEVDSDVIDEARFVLLDGEGAPATTECECECDHVGQGLRFVHGPAVTDGFVVDTEAPDA
jgi:hypothetical protein